MHAPARWACDVVLADGETAHIRPIEPGDAAALAAFHAGLSEETVALRFFGLYPVLEGKMLHRFTVVDNIDRVAFVGEVGGHLAGVGRFDRIAGTSDAEVAFVVADRDQGRGLGTLLFEHLAAAARERGISRFLADMLAYNRRMLGVFRSMGLPEEAHLDGDVVSVVLSIEPTSSSRAASTRRARQAGASVGTDPPAPPPQTAGTDLLTSG